MWPSSIGSQAVCVCACVHTRMHTCTYLPACMYVCVSCVCVLYVCVYVFLCVSMCLCVCVLGWKSELPFPCSISYLFPMWFYQQKAPTGEQGLKERENSPTLILETILSCRSLLPWLWGHGHEPQQSWQLLLHLDLLISSLQVTRCWCCLAWIPEVPNTHTHTHILISSLWFLKFSFLWPCAYQLCVRQMK